MAQYLRDELGGEVHEEGHLLCRYERGEVVVGSSVSVRHRNEEGAITRMSLEKR